jgi:hypothetical protein
MILQYEKYPIRSGVFLIMEIIVETPIYRVSAPRKDNDTALFPAGIM